VIVILPAEYGVDPTGAGRALGLTAIHGPAQALRVKDVIGGNAAYRDVQVTDPLAPIPLPNPAVAQIKAAAPQSRTISVTIPEFQETEIKALMDEAQVILYSWHADDNVYVDFHGHEPDAGSAFVRYEEQQSTNQGHGSLVAPFSGEHGWYWLNIGNKPVTIQLTVSGYFNGIKDYGILRSGP
jgi:hypothetical protein